MSERHDISVYDPIEIEVLRDEVTDLKQALDRRRRRDLRSMASGFSFAVAGSALALGLGGGALGVAFVCGVTAGLVSLIVGDD